MENKFATTPKIKSQKILPTDIELCCNIIFTFYKFPESTYLTADEIINCLHEYMSVSKSRVVEILECLQECCLCMKKTTIDPSSNDFITISYKWAIRRDENNKPYVLG